MKRRVGKEGLVRRVVWGGFAVFLVAAGAWLASGWCVADLRWTRASGWRCFVGMEKGCARVGWGYLRRGMGARRPGWTSDLGAGRRPRWDWAPEHKYMFGFGIGPHREVVVPLWMPVVAVGIPTGLGARRLRKRPRPGSCVCGYSLEGILGRCPECGRGLGGEG